MKVLLTATLLALAALSAPTPVQALEGQTAPQAP